MNKQFGPFQPGELEKSKPADADRTPKRRIIYAAGHLGLDRGGAADDPMSPSFIPLEQRNPIERARLFARRYATPQPKSVEFD